MNCRINIAVLLVAASVSAQAQNTLGYEDFMKLVSERNAGYVAEKYNVEIAEANLMAAKVFNDPEISFGYSDNQDWNMHMGRSFETELSYTVSLGNVRKCRINVAGTEKSISEQALSDYFCNLKAQASAAYSDAWASARKAEIMLESYRNMKRTADSDSLRLLAGEINVTDAMQSALEAKRMRNGWVAAEAARRSAAAGLSPFAGGEKLFPAMDDLPSSFRYAGVPLPELVSVAMENRSDLKSAELARKLSEDNLRLVRASRAMEISFNVGYSYNTEVKNEIAPAPQFSGLSAGISIPLKFSSANKGEIQAARSAVSQSAKAYEAAEEQIEAEVTAAYEMYSAALDIMDSFEGSIIDDVRTILENRALGYAKGEIGLLDYLEAQRSYNEVMSSYIDACSDFFHAGTELDRVLGM